MIEVNTCFDSDFSRHRITDATLGKAYFTLHSDFTDRRAVIYNSKSLPQQTTLSMFELQTLKLYGFLAFFLLYVNLCHFIQF